MRNRKTEAVDGAPAGPSTKRPAADLETGKRKETPGATQAPDPGSEKPSAMIEEGERPAPDHGSVEGLASAERPGGMIGEG